jgi:hypothetical protein
MTNSKEFLCYSPSHKLARIEEDFSKGYVFELDKEVYQSVSDRFVFCYRIPDSSEPQLILTRNDRNYNTPFAMSMNYTPYLRF